MSGFGQAGDEANFLGQLDYSEITQVGRFATATVTTNQVSANATESFEVSEDEPIVDAVNIIPEDQDLPTRARLISVKVNIDQNTSTDTDIKLFQSENIDPINEVVRITNVSEGDTPDTFVFGGGIGTPFINKQEESKIYIEIDELSGNDATYGIELNWLNLSR